jgi:glycosyltransferase involved in cell wall biosynthesis
MNILHVIPGLTWERGGPSTCVQGLAHWQAEAGHRVVVLTTDQGVRHGEQPVELRAAVEVQRLRVLGPDHLAYAPGLARAVRAQLRTADVVHVHSIFTQPVHVVLREALAAAVPVVLRPCGLLHRYSLRRSRLQKWVYLALWGGRARRACSAWHYTSENEARDSWPWDNSSRFILSNGIDPAEYPADRAAARRQVWRWLPQLGGAAYVLFLGRLHPKKRLDLLLKAFLAGAPQSFKLVVAGPDECQLWKPLAARFLQEVQTRRRVVRVGMVAAQERAVLLAGASLFALSSEHENFGITALEALAAGTPVILSPQVDFAQAAVAAGLGATVPLKVEAWRERLAESLTGADRLEALARRARDWVRAHYSWERITTELDQRYRWVLAGCPVQLAGAATVPA